MSVASLLTDGQEPRLDLAWLRELYQSGSLTPRALVGYLLEQMAAAQPDPAWIHVLSEAELEPYLQTLESCEPGDKPLYGIPFAIKDNIDLAGIPTTAACPAFSYVPEQSATVVKKLIDAGAIPIGKTNLDQFATGLVGTRSPYGAVPNAFDPVYISGGSSSGSASAVARGLVSFALGTDTAGSGRVPAAFNNLVGMKPSLGLVSSQGLVPACRTLDCITAFSLNPADAELIHQQMVGFDSQDPYSQTDGVARPWQVATRIGVPKSSQLEFFGFSEGPALFADAVKKAELAGAVIEELDFAPFFDAAKLLYEGPWVAERYAAIESIMQTNAEALYPVTRDIIAGAEGQTAVDAFKSQYRLQALKRTAQDIWQELDAILIPTAPRCYTLAEIETDPIKLNSNLGTYTNFMNLLDCAAIALPAGFDQQGMPFGVTLFSQRDSDGQLLNWAHRFYQQQPLTQGITTKPWRPALPETPNLNIPGSIAVAVCGAHLDGMPLNWQLKDRQAVLLSTTTTSPYYRFYALAGGPPYRPGLIRDEQQGAAIEVEVWAVPEDQFGTFVAGIPAPLGIGKVELANGEWVTSFICEPRGVEGAKEITDLGGWRAFIANQQG